MNRGLIIGSLSAVLSACLSSLSYPTTAEAVKSFPLVQLMFLRALVPGVIYLFWTRFRIPKHALRQLVIHRREFVFLVGVRGLLGDLLFYFILLWSSSIKVMFLTKLEPYVVLFIAWVTGRERVEGRELWLLLIHVLGAVLLATGGKVEFDQEVWGDLLLLLAIFLMALSYRPAATVSLAAGSYHVGGVKALAVSILLSPFVLMSGLAPFTAIPSSGWGSLLISIVFWDILGAPLYYESVRNIPGWLASALRAVGPVVAAPIAYYWLGLSLSNTQILGAAFVVITSLLLSIQRAK